MQGLSRLAVSEHVHVRCYVNCVTLLSSSSSVEPTDQHVALHAIV